MAIEATQILLAVLKEDPSNVAVHRALSSTYAQSGRLEDSAREAEAVRVLALEWGPDIRVNGVSPGAILWPDGTTDFSEAERERIVRQAPLKRVGTPEDIAGAVKFLMLDAPYVTGQILAVDGGREIAL